MGNKGSSEDLSSYMQACRKGDLATIKQLIDSNRVNVDSHDGSDEYNALHYASGFATQPAVVNLLFEYCVKKNPNAMYPLDIILDKRDGWGRTPIYFACGFAEKNSVPNIEMLRTLFERGSSVVGKNREGTSIQSEENRAKKKISLATKQTTDRYTPLAAAIGMNFLNVVEFLINEIGVDPLSMVDYNKYRAALHLAAANDKFAEIVEFLLKHPKAREMLTMKDGSGMTPLDIARSSGAAENVSLLEPACQQHEIGLTR